VRRIRALICDDEPAARDSIRTLLQREPDVETVAECATGPDTLRCLLELRPDLLFLDVQLPGWNGVEVLQQTPAEAMPVVIFVTAFDDYALPAFDHKAADYLLKPYSDARFSLALGRARERLDHRSTLDLRRDVLALAERVAGPEPGLTRPAAGSYLKCLPMGTATGLSLVRTSEIKWVEAAGDYAKVHAEGRSFLLRATMQGLERRLDPSKFIRIHRSTIINLDFVQEIRGSHGAEYAIVLKDGTSRPASERGREQLARALGIRL
jgi:two-component system LytT family response regulator